MSESDFESDSQDDRGASTYDVRVTGFSYNHGYNMDAAAGEITKLLNVSKEEAEKAIKELTFAKHITIADLDVEQANSVKRTLEATGLVASIAES